MIAMDLIGPGFTERTVTLRVFSPADASTRPDIALDEFRLLQTLVETVLPVPRALHVDQTCEILPLPAVVLEYVEGETRLHSENAIGLVCTMADMLLFIHSFDPIILDLKFLPDEKTRNEERLANPPQSLDISLQEDSIRNTLADVWPHVSRNASMLLHGDYWAGNILWSGDQIAAVIDWENAQRGDPVEDFANARLEVLWAYGYEAMEAFSMTYIGGANLDFGALPAFDLMAALRPCGRLQSWGLEPSKELSMRNAHKLFVAEAMKELNG